VAFVSYRGACSSSVALCTRFVSIIRNGAFDMTVTSIPLMFEGNLSNMKVCNPWADSEGSRRARLPDFKTVGT
jgi:hypothetical protein